MVAPIGPRAQVEVLHRVRAGALGALLVLSPRAGWLHVELRWPGGDRASVAVHPRTDHVHPVGGDGRVNERPVSAELAGRLRREVPPSHTPSS